jgi:heme/copper-type cytochrome/quinol oxidase subunit 3
MPDGGRPATPTFSETPDEVAFELRAHEGALWTAGRLLIGVWAFAFVSLAFAYFYLRSGNNDDLWRLPGQTAPTGSGAAIFAFTLAAGVLCILAARRLATGRRLEWTVAGWTSVVLALVAAGLQVWQMTQLSFSPGSSGYASCFVGWAGVNVAVLLCGAYWLETSLAHELRLHADEARGGAGRVVVQLRQLTVSVDACAWFWGFLCVVLSLFWLLFYVV